MKNRIALLTLIFASLHVQAQNIFPDTGDAVIRGSSIKIERPNTSGGWARGTFFYQLGDISTPLAGYGLLGTANKPSLLYMAHGKSPWVSSLGLYVRTSGNVGIGTTNPQESLHVKGNVRGNATGGALRVKTSSGYLDIGSQNASWAHIYTDRPRIILNKDAYTVTGGFSSYNTSDLRLKTNGTERLTIKNNNGNVGIGTTAPDEKLTVKGKIHTQEVRVDLDGVIAPDYVFEKYYLGESSLKTDYEMPTLEELETFTKENHHLPEIASSKEMQENGIQLKEMNLKLLQKIEELTLYTIQQENKIQLQEEKNNSLESRLEKIEAFIKSAKN